jgi:hypothetical protein
MKQPDYVIDEHTRQMREIRERAKRRKLAESLWASALWAITGHESAISAIERVLEENEK